MMVKLEEVIKAYKRFDQKLVKRAPLEFNESLSERY